MTLETRARSRRGRIGLAALALALAGTSIATFWLADSGALALPQAPTPSGAAANGSIATFATLAPPTITVPETGGAQRIDGVPMGKLSIAAGFASKVKVDISWLDPKNAGGVLKNPNAWITFGTYYPIHTGVCLDTDAVGSQIITEGASTICVAPNTQGTGLLVRAGRIIINASMLSGFIVVTATDPASPPTCGPTGSTWCAPPGTPINQNLLYIVASIDTPGGTPSGQLPQLTTLNFYIAARSN